MSASIDKPVVIVGGGIAGLRVAKVLSDNGFASVIVERTNKVGGHVRDWGCMATDRCMRCYCCSVHDVLEKIQASPLVTLMEGWELCFMPGPGRVGVKCVATGEEKAIDCAALVLANGFEPYDPAEKELLGYGRIPGVLTLKDLDALVRDDRIDRLAEGVGEPLKVAFFQCVGSRDKSSGANYCSQYCCKAAVRMGLKLRNEHPEWEITIFYIDLQIAGKFAGSLFSEVERNNIRLAQGVPGEIVPGTDNMLEIVRQENGVNVREQYHRVVLSIGQRPSASTGRLVSVVGMELNELGFLAGKDLTEASRTAIPAVYLAGACAGPKDIEQTLSHAEQTAAAVIADLTQ